MRCHDCSVDITFFRIVGVCDFNEFAAKEFHNSEGNIPLLISSSFTPVAMLTCSCGAVRFLTVKRAIESGLSQDGNTRGEMTIPPLGVPAHGK